MDEEMVVNQNWDVIRRIMWNYVGIVRKKSSLDAAKKKISALKKEVDETPHYCELVY